MHDYRSERELLTKVSGVCVIDLMDKIPLMDEFYQYMKPLEEGLYNKINNNLVFKADVKYFSLDRSGDKKPLNTLADFRNCKETIVNEANNFYQIFDVKSMAVRKNLATKPTVDGRCLSIIEKCVDDYLYGLCPHTRTTMNGYPLDKQLKDGLTLDNKESLVDNLQVMLCSVIDEVSEFVGHDTWHFYFTKRKGSALVISKTVDYRIFDWYRIKWQAEEVDPDTREAMDIFNIFSDK